MKEGEILIDLLHADSSRRESLRELFVQAAPDWGQLEVLASNHGVLPLIGTQLKDLGYQPQNIERRVRELTIRAIEMIHASSALSEAFKDAGIQLAFFKGPALALRVYETPELRTGNDIDVLIRKSDFDTAEEILQALGYHPVEKLTKLQKSSELRFQNALEFLNPKTEIIVDLHWAPLRNFYGFPIAVERILEKAITLSFSNREYLVPCEQHSLLLQAAHGGKHTWNELKWIVDFQYSIKTYSDTNYSTLRSLAKETGTLRMLKTAYYLLDTILGVKLPEAFDKTFDDQKIVIQMSEEIRERLIDDEELGVIDTFWQDLRLRENKKDKLRYIFFRILTPHGEDWRFITLPDALFRLYYVIRPFRLLLRYLGVRR